MGVYEEKLLSCCQQLYPQYYHYFQSSKKAGYIFSLDYYWEVSVVSWELSYKEQYVRWSDRYESSTFKLVLFSSYSIVGVLWWYQKNKTWTYSKYCLCIHNKEKRDMIYRSNSHLVFILKHFYKKSIITLPVITWQTKPRTGKWEPYWKSFCIIGIQRPKIQDWSYEP